MAKKKKGSVTPKKFKYVFSRNYNRVADALEKYGSKVREVRIIYPSYDYAKDYKCRIVGWRPKSGNGSMWYSRVTRDEQNGLLTAEDFNKVWGYVQSGDNRRNFTDDLEEFKYRLFKGAYDLWCVVVIDETTPKAKKPATRKKPSQVTTVRKLVSEGKIPAGHVRRLGIRKQTPPPPKSRKADEKRKAMLAGYRVSKNGNLYYETRENRSDKPREKPRRGRRVPVKTTPKKGSKK